MKPVNFKYEAPASLEEAGELLLAHSGEAKILAGGQSLIPLLSMRLARPQVIVDINRVRELEFIRVEEDGLHLGAMVRQARLEEDALIARYCYPLKEVAALIGHPATRCRGTVGGSLAHADPAAVLPALLMALGARFKVYGEGERWVPADDFFLTYFTTVLGPEEILTEIEVPFLEQGRGVAFKEFNRRWGDFAMAGIAVLLTVDATGKIRQARLVPVGVEGAPRRIREVETRLEGEPGSHGLFEEAGSSVAREVEAQSDLNASADYRRRLLRVLTIRALEEAYLRAKGESDRVQA